MCVPYLGQALPQGRISLLVLQDRIQLPTRDVPGEPWILFSFVEVWITLGPLGSIILHEPVDPVTPLIFFLSSNTRIIKVRDPPAFRKRPEPLAV